MFIRTSPADHALGYHGWMPTLGLPVSKNKKLSRSLYGVRSFPALSAYYDGFDGGLGKSLLKKITKAVAAPVKIAIAPIAVMAASSANAVGLRNVAGKIVDATAVNKKAAAAEKKISKAGGWAIDAGAAVVGGTLLAPVVGSAATGGATALHTAGAGLFAKGAGILGGLKNLIPGAKAAASPGILDAVGNVVSKNVRGLKRTVNSFVPGSGQPGTDGAAVTPEVMPGSEKKMFGGFKKRAADTASLISQAVQQAQGSQTPAPALPEAPAPVEASMFGDLSLSNPKLLLAGAAVSLLFLHPWSKSKSRKRR